MEWAIPEKIRTGGRGRGGLGWGYGISRGIIRNSMCNFRGQLKTKWDFRGWTSKNKVDGVFAFGLGISKGSNTILWNIQELRCVFSGSSRDKVKKWKVLGEVSKTHILLNITPFPPAPPPAPPTVWISPIIAQYLIHYVKFNMWPALFYVNSLCFPNIFECWC